MNKEHHLKNVKAIVGILVLAIVAVIFYKFITNENYFFQDATALRNYVIFAIVGAGFLVGLLYLTSQTTHKPSAKSKTVKLLKIQKEEKIKSIY